jgi:hypothetical protein
MARKRTTSKYGAAKRGGVKVNTNNLDVAAMSENIVKGFKEKGAITLDFAQLCDQKGISMKEALKQMDNTLDKYLKKKKGK